MRRAALALAALVAACGGGGISRPSSPAGAVEVGLSFTGSGARTPPFAPRTVRVERGAREIVEVLRPYRFDGVERDEKPVQTELPIGVRVVLIAVPGRKSLFYSVRWSWLRESRFHRTDSGVVLEMPVVSEVRATGLADPIAGAEVSVRSPLPFDEERLVLTVPGRRSTSRRREEGETRTRWAYLMDYDVEVSQSAMAVGTVLGWVDPGPGWEVVRFDTFSTTTANGPALNVELPEIRKLADPNSLTVGRIAR